MIFLVLKNRLLIPLRPRPEHRQIRTYINGGATDSPILDLAPRFSPSLFFRSWTESLCWSQAHPPFLSSSFFSFFFPFLPTRSPFGICTHLLSSFSYSIVITFSCSTFRAKLINHVDNGSLHSWWVDLTGKTSLHPSRSNNWRAGRRWSIHSSHCSTQDTFSNFSIEWIHAILHLGRRIWRS